MTILSPRSAIATALSVAYLLTTAACRDTCDTHYLGESIYVVEVNSSPCVSGCDMVLGEDCQVLLPTGANGIGGEVRSWRTIRDRDDPRAFHRIERVRNAFLDRTDTIQNLVVYPLSKSR